ncbi:MAG: hypothetical protein AB1921_09050 [Thermodesulfobacteriota bacterium]
MADETLKKVIEISYQMLELADHGDRMRQDAGSGVVYGALRDAAYKIRRMAEKELSRKES